MHTHRDTHTQTHALAHTLICIISKPKRKTLINNSMNKIIHSRPCIIFHRCFHSLSSPPYIYMYIHTHTYIYTHTHTYIYILVHTHTYIYTHIYIYTCTHTHIYIYTHTRAHTHIYICVCVCDLQSYHHMMTADLDLVAGLKLLYHKPIP